MKKIVALFALALPLMAQEGFDFRLLDKLGANARNKTNLSLDGDMLKLAAGVLSGDSETESIRSLVRNLKGVYIRSWEFDKDGQYNEADLEPFRTYLREGQWNRILESREDGEISEIYLRPLANDRLGGVAIISLEAKEVTIVCISGDLKQEDIAKLSGNMGIPDIRLPLDSGKPAKGKKGEKKEDEE